jgi:hypothetical protein
MAGRSWRKRVFGWFVTRLKSPVEPLGVGYRRSAWQNLEDATMLKIRLPPVGVFQGPL